MTQPRRAAAAIGWVLTLSWPTAAGAQPLPEGDTGIAAQYPGDVGIASAAAVLFHEDFEAITDGSLTYDNSNFDAAYGENVITQLPADVHAGAQAVERTHSSPTSFGAVKYLGPGFDTVHLRYYLKHHAEFPGCHHIGGGIYAAAGSGYTQIGDITGIQPDGANHFQAWLDDLAPFFGWSPPANDTPPGWLHFYCYNMDQGSEYGDHLFSDGTVIPGASGVELGSGFVPRPNCNPVRGTWASYEVMLTANTPGLRDGRIAFWVDGLLAGDFPGIQFRSTDALAPNHVAITTYASEVFPNQTMWYDDVVAATSYIGPMFFPGGDGGAGGAGGAGAAGAAGAPVGGSAAGGGVAGSGTVLPSESDDDGGCGCRVAPGARAARAPMASCAGLGVLLLAWGLRRPRRRWRLRAIAGELSTARGA